MIQMKHGKMKIIIIIMWYKEGKFKRKVLFCLVVNEPFTVFDSHAFIDFPERRAIEMYIVDT